MFVFKELYKLYGCLLEQELVQEIDLSVPIGSKAKKVNLKEEVREGFCIITEKIQQLTRLHPPIKGIKNTFPGGSPLISVNIKSALSYGQTSTFCAPFSKEAALKYAAALNYLTTNKEPNLEINLHVNKMYLDDVTIIFWTEDNNAEITKYLRDNLQSVYINYENYPLLDKYNKKIFFLAMTGNNGRIAIQSWHVFNFQDYKDRINKLQNKFKNAHTRSCNNVPIWQLQRQISSNNIFVNMQLFKFFIQDQNVPMNIYVEVINKARSGFVNDINMSIVEMYLENEGVIDKCI